jgi:hypothetical protein
VLTGSIIRLKTGRVLADKDDMDTPQRYEQSPEPPGLINTSASAPAAPLDERHYEALRDAKTRRKKIDRAIAVASFNGWSIGIFAALSALFLPLSLSLLGVLVTLGLGAVAYHEFKGRRMLRALDVRGPRLLGFNQIGFGVVIVGYCVWNLAVELGGPGAYAQTIQEHPELGEILGSTEGLYRMAVVLVYGTVIVLTIPYQALMAWYYFSRSKHLETYIRQTPGWVTDLERAAA